MDVTRIVLPSLQIVRGRTLFKLSVDEDEYALIVTLSKMHNLEMPALRGMNNFVLLRYKPPGKLSKLIRQYNQIVVT